MNHIGNQQMSSIRAQKVSETERRKILVIGTLSHINETLSDYAIHLAQRLKNDLFVVCIVPGSNIIPSTKETALAMASTDCLRHIEQKAARQGVHCDVSIQYGEISLVTDEVLNSVKRIEFIVTDSEYTKAQISNEVTIPVFSLCISQHYQEERPMTRESKEQRKLEVKKTIGYGLITAALYGCVFWNADTVMSYFTKGGFFAALPVATVFIFSFAHGAFASNFWSLMGIKPMKKDTVQPTAGKSVTQTKKVQKRPRAYAYVNPFHKI